MEFSIQQIGKFLILIGILIALVGAVFLILGHTGLFKLPGAFVFSGKNWKVYFPIATSIIISIIATIILWLINYFRK